MGKPSHKLVVGDPEGDNLWINLTTAGVEVGTTLIKSQGIDNLVNRYFCTIPWNHIQVIESFRKAYTEES